MNLPANPTMGDSIIVVDANGFFGTNKITIGRNSKPILGLTEDFEINTKNSHVEFVFLDNTQGWKVNLGGALDQTRTSLDSLS